MNYERDAAILEHFKRLVDYYEFLKESSEDEVQSEVLDLSSMSSDEIEGFKKAEEAEVEVLS